MTVPPNPRFVSVIIGTRNRPDMLRKALASIRAIEGPDLKFEILVGDNGTTPETAGIVAEFGGIYDKTDVYGCPAARNLALRRVSGEFIAFIDDDDVWLPGHVRPHIAFLDAHPDYEAVFGQIITADENLNPIALPWPEKLPANGDVFRPMMSGYFPQVGATVVRGRALAKYGLMDEALIGDSDWDWQLRIAGDNKIGHVQEPCVLFRQRKKGAFNALQLRRAGYTRRIFIRHALANRKRWGSALEMIRSYFESVSTYYSYFMDVAADRAMSGDRVGAAKALASAFWVLPTRTVRALLGRPHRTTLANIFLPGAARPLSEDAGQAHRG
ncbi:MAG: glycosyltransferase [Hyphomonadaceae bacterium]|nr:glycosyltransferase [Hyphomonadaceae bacterium]